VIVSDRSGLTTLWEPRTAKSSHSSVWWRFCWSGNWLRYQFIELCTYTVIESMAFQTVGKGCPCGITIMSVAQSYWRQMHARGKCRSSVAVRRGNEWVYVISRSCLLARKEALGRYRSMAEASLSRFLFKFCALINLLRSWYRERTLLTRLVITACCYQS